MPRRLILPPPLLRPLVRVYWLLDESAPRAESHVFMPEHTAHLDFHAGRSWTLGKGKLLTPLPTATLSGLVTEPTSLVSEGPVRALRAELYPWAARQLFGWSYPDPTLDLPGGAAGSGAARTARGIAAALAARDDETAVGLLNGWLLALLAQSGREPGAGVRAAVQLYHGGGQLRVAELAQAQDLSPRTLERQFAQEVGIGAKTLGRLIRFETAHNTLAHDPQTPLAALAYDLGFSDQAHLTREFRNLGGLTPGTFARLSEGRSQDPFRSEGRSHDLFRFAKVDPGLMLPRLPG